jgi:hypothetical protein
MTTNPNFEVLCNIGESSVCQEYTRYNNEAGYPWSTGVPTGIDTNSITHVSMVVSKPWGNLEAVLVTPGGDLQHWYRNPNDPAGVWYFGGDILSQASYPDAIAGPPSLIQAVPSSANQIGNFELLAPGQSGILHFTRNNNASGFPWSLQEDSGFGGGGVQGVSLIQSDYGVLSGGGLFGGPGNLECVFIDASNNLVHWYRDPGTGIWKSSVTITNSAGAQGIGSAPAFLQPSGGYAQSAHGNFEVVVPVAAPGGASLAHYTRNNSPAGGETWSLIQEFGAGYYPTLVFSTFGNLEMVVAGIAGLSHWYQYNGAWFQSTAFAPGLNPALAGFVQDALPPQDG